MTISILVPFRPSDSRRGRNLEWCRRRWQKTLPSANFILGVSPDGPFNRAAAINDARKKVMNDPNILIVADADTHGDPAAIMQAVMLCDSDLQSPWYLPYNRYYNLTDSFSDYVISQVPDFTFSEGTFEFEHRIPSPPVIPYGDPVSGILIIPTKAFDLVGGFDEQYSGWGYEDKDFANRLDDMWGPHKRIDGYVFHLWHPVTIDPFQTPECKANAERYNANRDTRTG